MFSTAKFKVSKLDAARRQLETAVRLHFSEGDPVSIHTLMSAAYHRTMDERTALRFIREHGIVLESAHGSVPTFADAAAGARIRGSWWAHPKSHEIFWLTRAIRESADVLVCRLLDGKITYVHRRLWPALVRLSSAFRNERLAAIHEIHTAVGKHVVKVKPFPAWVPQGVAEAADRLTASTAWASLGLPENMGGQRRVRAGKARPRQIRH